MSKIVEKSTNRKAPPDIKKSRCSGEQRPVFYSVYSVVFPDHLRLISTTSLQALSPAESVMTQRYEPKDSAVRPVAQILE